MLVEKDLFPEVKDMPLENLLIARLARKTGMPSTLGLKLKGKMLWNGCIHMYAMWMPSHMLVHNIL